MKLKGKTIIELTDVNTNEVTTYEDTNMVTNALNYLLAVPGMDVDETFWATFLPMYANALGGLVLFDKAIEESAENILPPPDASEVGVAAYNYQNATTYPLCGSYNSTESLYDKANKAMKYVYDFTTAQANGVIESVCLSHLNARGCYGSPNASGLGGVTTLAITRQTSSNRRRNLKHHGTKAVRASLNNTTLFQNWLFMIDEKEDIAYYLNLVSPTQFSITKRRAGFNSISPIKDNNTAFDDIDILETVLLPELSESMYSIDNPGYGSMCCNYDRYDNCLYIYPWMSNDYSLSLNANKDFKIYKVDMSDLTKPVEEISMTNTCGYPIFLYYGICSRGQFMTCIYDSDNSAYKIASFEIGASTNCKIITYESDADKITNVPYPRCDVNGRVYWASESGRYDDYVYVTTPNSDFYKKTMAEYLKKQNSYNHDEVPFKHHPLAYFDGAYQSPSLFLGYLATINNLDTPIEKTSRQTMKITYIIQEVS